MRSYVTVRGNVMLEMYGNYVMVDGKHLDDLVIELLQPESEEMQFKKVPVHVDIEISVIQMGLHIGE